MSKSFVQCRAEQIRATVTLNLNDRDYEIFKVMCSEKVSLRVTHILRNCYKIPNHPIHTAIKDILFAEQISFLEKRWNVTINKLNEDWVDITVAMVISTKPTYLQVKRLMQTLLVPFIVNLCRNARFLGTWTVKTREITGTEGANNPELIYAM